MPFKYSPSFRDEVVSLYKKGVSSKRIEKELGRCTSKTVIKILKQYNVPIRDNGNKKYSLNENYFNCIDTPAKAYVLGFICADGCVVDSVDALSISLHPKDDSVLELIKSELSYTGPVRLHDPKKSVQENKAKTLVISSTKICNDLIQLSCVPRKSLILRFPTEEQVPDRFIFHFLRGYFDGDGSISGDNYQCYLCCSFEFGQFLTNFLEGKNITSYLYRCLNSKIYRVRITRKKDFFCFMRLLYNDSENLRLTRKYNQYINHINKNTKNN